MAQPNMARKAPTSTPFNFSTPEIRSHYPEFSARLLERREELVGRAHVARANLDEQIMTAPGDAADESVLDTSADYFLSRANTAQAELVEIGDALDRVEQGSYGMCENCENPIALDRLKNLPYARFCIDCQTALERSSVRTFPKL
jgi:DnaK suppressor protein